MDIVQLSDVCTIGNGFAFKSTQFKSTGIPLLKISNIINERVSFEGRTVYLDESMLLTQQDFVVNKGDVVIALSGATTGKYGVYQLDTPCLLNQRIGVIRQADSEHLDLRYFYFYLNELKSEILRKAQGAAQPNISTKDIGRFKIPLPSLAEQKKIAEILDAADSLRQKNQQLIEHYTVLSQSLFLDMFGDPVTNPKGWDEIKLNDGCSKISVGFVGVCEPFYTDKTGVPMIRTGNLSDNGLKLRALKYVTKEFHDKQKKSQLLKGDLLIARHGDNGKAVLFKGEFDAANCLNIVILRVNSTDLNDLYTQYYLNNENTRKLIQSRTGGATQKVINTKEIQKLMVPAPPIKLQESFAERIDAIEKQKQQAQASLKKTEALFNSLLQRAFKGDLTESKAV